MAVLSVFTSACTSVYGPARLGMNTHLLQKPIVIGQEKADTSATYAGIEYTRSSYLSEQSEPVPNDIVNAFTLRAHRSYVKNRVAWSFGGSFTLGSRTFPSDSTGNTLFAPGRFQHSSLSAFGELAVPFVEINRVNFYPFKAGFFYTYEFGESMGFLENNIPAGSRIDAFTNRHMPSLVVAHELMILAQEGVVIGIDLGQVFTFNANKNYVSPGSSYSNVFYSLRASLSLSADRYTVNFTGTTGLHSGFTMGLMARIGK